MASARPEPPSAADRGSLRIADRVVARIASRAAGEVLCEAPGANFVPRRAGAHASVSVRKNTARLHLTLELGYPADLGAVSAEVRRHVSDRVAALTGMAVPEVAVEIERLHSAAVHREREGRVR